MRGEFGYDLFPADQGGVGQVLDLHAHGPLEDIIIGLLMEQAQVQRPVAGLPLMFDLYQGSGAVPDVHRTVNLAAPVGVMEHTRTGRWRELITRKTARVGSASG